MTKYRILNKGDTWHWCTNCPDWPTKPGTYIEKEYDGRPPTGELDNKCLKYEKEKTCKEI